MTLVLCSSLLSFPKAYRLRSILMFFRYAAVVLLAAFLTSVPFYKILTTVGTHTAATTVNNGGTWANAAGIVSI